MDPSTREIIDLATAIVQESPSKSLALPALNASVAARYPPSTAVIAASGADPAHFYAQFGAGALTVTGNKVGLAPPPPRAKKPKPKPKKAVRPTVQSRNPNPYPQHFAAPMNASAPPFPIPPPNAPPLYPPPFAFGPGPGAPFGAFPFPPHDPSHYSPPSVQHFPVPTSQGTTPRRGGSRRGGPSVAESDPSTLPEASPVKPAPEKISALAKFSRTDDAPEEPAEAASASAEEVPSPRAGLAESTVASLGILFEEACAELSQGASDSAKKSVLVPLEDVERLELREYAEIGTLTDSGVRVALNVHEPFCLVTVGVQGAGKSHSIGAVIESCVLPVPGIINLSERMSVLVCHYDKTESNPCEVASLALPSRQVLSHFEKEGVLAGGGEYKDASGKSVTLPTVEKIVILVSPTYYKQRKAMYDGMPNTEVRPLLFSWSRLKASQLKTLMHIQRGDAQLYMASMLDILRNIQRKGEIREYETFKKLVLGDMKSPSQNGPLVQRLAILDSLVAESSSYTSADWDNGYRPTYLEELVEPGTVVIADLTDPFVDSETANGIFQVLLEQFRDTDVPQGKLCVFDEAHKYLSDTKDTLSDSIVETVRQMRHYGTRVAISTQSPTILPGELLELTSLAICHRFHSRDWYECLSRKIPLPTGGLGDFLGLSPGEAFVFASKHSCQGREFYSEIDGESRVFKMKTRLRLTADGGSSRTNGKS